MAILHNWNHEIRFEVADSRLKTPTQTSDVQDIVKQASSQKQPVTVVGAMHSTTECMVGDGIVISMKNMARVLSVDEQNMTVTVQAGATLHEVCSHLKDLGFQLPVILEFGNFQIGAMSGTHANDTSMRCSAQFSSHVTGVTLVTPTGDVMEVSEAKNPEYLPAVRSHFGMLGVVCDVTVRVFKTQPLHVRYQLVEVNSFLDGFALEMQALKAANDQVFGMIFPGSGKLLWQCRQFVETAKSNPHSPADWLDSIESKSISLFGDLFLPLTKAITAAQPSAAAAKLGAAALVDLGLKIFQHSSYTIDPSDRGIIYGKDDPGFEFYDWVFPEGNWVALVRDFLDLSERFRREREFILPLPALIYFLKQDQASLLSRSRGGDMIAVDPLYPEPSDPTWKAFRLAFNGIAMKHSGIPHINKTRDGAINNFAKACDQDSLKRYLEVRKQLDPKNLFLNEFFKTVFVEFL